MRRTGACQAIAGLPRKRHGGVITVTHPAAVIGITAARAGRWAAPVRPPAAGQSRRRRAQTDVRGRRACPASDAERVRGSLRSGPARIRASRRRRRRTATCSTSTTTWPQEFDLRMRVVARQVATVVVVDVTGGRAATRPTGSPPPERGFGVLVVDGVLAVDTSVGDRIADRARRPRRPAAAVGARPDDLLERSWDWRTLVPVAARAARRRASPSASGRGRRSSHVLLRRAGRRAGDLNVQRAIACQPRLEVRLTLLLWHLAGALGPGRAGRHPRPAAPHAPAARPARRRRAAVGVARARAALARPASSPATRTSGTCTARSRATWRR